jgi:hypothetical protein
MKLESYILNDFFEILNDKKINYCVMNNYEEMPEVISSDVDIAIDKTTFAALDSLIIMLAKKHDVAITQKIWHGYNKCAYILSPLVTERYFWLQLDFFVDFCAQGFPNLMPINVMLTGKRPYKNFFVPIPEVEVSFVLQRRIFKGDCQQAHVESLYNLYSKKPESVYKSVMDVFCKTAGILLIDFIKTKDINGFNNNYNFYKKALKEVSSRNTNFIYWVSYNYNQIKRALYRLYYPTGLCIGFLTKNLENQKILIDEIDLRISGSFHGTTKITLTNYFSYLVKMITIVYLSKVTKRKVYINLISSKHNWGIVCSNKILRILKLAPDVIFNNEETQLFSETNLENEKVINNLTFLILKKQAERTKRHLMHSMTPTAKLKEGLI